jgi:hypothetical protein
MVLVFLRLGTLLCLMTSNGMALCDRNHLGNIVGGNTTEDGSLLAKPAITTNEQLDISN